MNKKQLELLEEFKKINTSVEFIEAMDLVGEPYAKDGIAIKVTLDDGKWLRVYRNEHGELNWH